MHIYQKCAGLMRIYRKYAGFMHLYQRRAVRSQAAEGASSCSLSACQDLFISVMLQLQTVTGPHGSDGLVDWHAYVF